MASSTTTESNSTIISISSSINLQEMKETLDRIVSLPQVQGVWIFNREGDILGCSSNSSLNNNNNNNDDDLQKARECQRLLQSAQCAIMGNDDRVEFVQVRSQEGRELVLAPQEGYTLAVLKDTNHGKKGPENPST